LRFLHRLSARSIRALLWGAGLVALLAAIAAWLGPAQPYQAPWVWISFIGMCMVDDFVFGSKEQDAWSELPKVALLAAVIVFRRHPELTVLVAFIAAPMASLVKGQAWLTQVTATAQWVLAAVFGAATFRLIGFADTPHFIGATAALMAVYYLTGPVLSAAIQARESGMDFRYAFHINRRLFLTMEVAGVLLALAWRTPGLEPVALKIADGVLVTLAGILVGYLLGGRVSFLLRDTSFPARPLLAIGGLLVLSEFTPGTLSWLLPMGAAVGVGIWGVWRRAYPVVCGALGAYCNELVRAANGGRMPVDGPGVLASVSSHANTYVLASAHTNFAWLDDRFSLPVPFPGIASAGDLLIAVALAWLVASMMFDRQRRRPLGEAVDPSGTLALDAADPTAAA
jgi:Family of unknown function (DUF5317)